MKRLALLLPLLLFTTAPALAENETQIATLTADGTGVVSVAPDIVIVTIGVTTRGGNPVETLEENSASMQAVIDAVIAAGVAERDVATSGFSIGPIYADQRAGEGNEPARIIGYNVRNQVTVRIRNLDASGGILDLVVEAGASQINGIRFDIADPQPLEDEAMAAAIADAVRKAELMAAAADVRIVRILSVSAYSNSQPQFEVQRLATVPIMGGERSITANATVIFEIAPLSAP